MTSLYETFKRCQVYAADVGDFLHRYMKPERYALRGSEYMAAVLQSARDDLNKYGYVIISRHDSITGEVVSFYSEERKKGGTHD